MFRALVCLLVLGTTTPNRPAIEFLQPRAHLVLASPRGVELPIQIRIEPHADNRRYVITWCGDGASAQTLDGAEDSAIHPETPIIVRMFPGVCELTAAVYGPGNVLRARVIQTLLVCGGDEDTDACRER